MADRGSRKTKAHFPREFPQGPKRWRWLLLLAIAFLLTVLSLPLHLTQWGPGLLERLLSAQLHTAVTIHQLTGGWGSGIVVHGLSIAESSGAQAPVLLQAKRLTFNLPLAPLLFSTQPVSIHIEDMQIHLRRRQDGQWNVAALIAALATPGDTATAVALPARHLDVALTLGQLHLGPEGPMYRIEGQAESVSLATAPLQWRMGLTGPANETVTLQGQLHNLTGAAPLTGQAEVTGRQLDLAAVALVFPAVQTMHPHGHVETAHVRLTLGAEQNLDIQARVDLQAVRFPGAIASAEAELAYLRVMLQGQRRGRRWTCNTLSVEIPGGHVALREPAWLQAEAMAWDGQAAFALDVADIQTVTRALRGLLPAPLAMWGRLRVTGQVAGTFDRTPGVPWENRLARLRAHMRGRLDGAQWHEEVTNLAVAAHLADGVLTVEQASTGIASGKLTLQGHVALFAARPSGDLQWQITDLPLHRMLGDPVRRFTIARSHGRLTPHGDGYRLESTSHIPVFELALDDRELRLTDVTVTCALTLPVSFIQLTLKTCTVQADQAKLALHNGVINFGANPQLTVEVQGWLDGPFVGALAPEIPAQFPGPLYVQGPLRVALQGKVWPGMRWQLAVTNDQFTLAELTFTNLTCTVVKIPEQIDILDLQVRRANGRAQAAGAWRLTRPAQGRMQVHLQQMPLRRSLRHDNATSSYALAGTATGIVEVREYADGLHYIMDGQVPDLRLQRGDTTLVQIAMAQVQGTVGRTRDATWWAREVEIIGESATLVIREGRLQTGAETLQGAVLVDANLDAAGAWVTHWLAAYGVRHLKLTGRVQAVLRATGQQDRLLQTIQGQGVIRVADGAFANRAFSRLEATYLITPGHVEISQGFLAFQESVLEIQGNPLLLITRAPGDQLAITFRQVPLRLTQRLRAFRHLGPARLRTHTTLAGDVRLWDTPDGQLRGAIDVQTTDILRQLLQDTDVLQDVTLPPIHLTGEMQAVRPTESWHVPFLHLQGDGLKATLTNVFANRHPTHYELSGTVNWHASAAVMTGLTLGLLPPAMRLEGATELAGIARIRLTPDGRMALRDVIYSGTLLLEQIQVEDVTVGGWATHLTLATSRLTVDAGSAYVSGGKVRFGPGSFVDLQGPTHDFQLHVATEQLELDVQAGRRMSLLSPLFLLEPGQSKPVDISGKLAGELSLAGAYTRRPGWSKSVHGGGHFRITKGRVVGSALVSGFLSKAFLLPQNAITESLKALFGQGGKPGKAFVSVGRKAFAFGTLASPIRVRNGKIHLQENLTITAPEFHLVMNGYSTLEGDVDYQVHTDILQRLRLGGVMKLPEKIPVLGKIIRHLNPLNLLDHIELGATMKGNLFQTNAAGEPDVRVDVSLVR